MKVKWKIPKEDKGYLFYFRRNEQSISKRDNNFNKMQRLKNVYSLVFSLPGQRN